MWYLDWWPWKNVGVITYGATFAATWGLKARSSATTYADKLRFQVSKVSGAADRWMTTAGGSMFTTGVGGDITGRGLDLFICDDPVKNWEEANSEVMREKHWEWWQRTMMTRLEPGASVVFQMARWHEDDLAGRVLAASEAGEADKYEVIRLPALAESADDPMGRQVGQVLWPERWSASRLEARRKAVGEYAWLSLYQQRPTAEGGGKFKRAWFRYFSREGDGYVLHEPNGVERRMPGSLVWTFLTADLALSEKEEASRTAVGWWGVTRTYDLLLLDAWADHVEAPDAQNVLEQMYHNRGPQFIGIENKHYGTAVIQAFLRKGIPVKCLEADADKVTRAMTASTLTESGKVYFLRGAKWLAEYEHELCAFPKGTFDDQVDMTSYAALVMVQHGEGETWEPTSSIRDPAGLVTTMERMYA